jgi:threonine/homoserine/homoserine lactone efflux protein
MEGEGLEGLLNLAVLVAIYMIPALVARKRGHENTLAITALNILAGWTLVGWVVAFVWACTGPNRRRLERRAREEEESAPGLSGNRFRQRRR